MAYASTLRSALRSRVRERLLPTFWADAEINWIINESLRIWNVCTGCNRNIYSGVSFASGTLGYAIATKATTGMFILRIERSDNTHLDPITINELGNYDISWLSRTATDATNWMQVGANSIFLYPKLSSTMSSTSIYTVDVMTVPTSDSDYIQVGEEDMPYLIDYCVFVARLKEGGKETTEAVALLQGFLQQAAKYNSKIQQTSLYKRVLGLSSQRQTRNPSLDQPSMR